MSTTQRATISSHPRSVTTSCVLRGDEDPIENAYQCKHHFTGEWGVDRAPGMSCSQNISPLNATRTGTHTARPRAMWRTQTAQCTLVRPLPPSLNINISIVGMVPPARSQSAAHALYAETPVRLVFSGSHTRVDLAYLSPVGMACAIPFDEKERAAMGGILDADASITIAPPPGTYQLCVHEMNSVSGTMYPQHDFLVYNPNTVRGTMYPQHDFLVYNRASHPPPSPLKCRCKSCLARAEALETTTHNSEKIFKMLLAPQHSQQLW